MTAAPVSGKGFEALRAFSKRRPAREHCELCGIVLPPEHPHLLQFPERRIVCGCEPCSILFSHRDGAAHYRRIPRDTHSLNDFEILDAEWNELRLPIDLAFFVNDSAAARMMVYYPGPAGATESLLTLDAWERIANSHPLIASMETDVEALLVNRTHGRNDAFRMPIDRCYRLTGIIRLKWRGFSGGEAVWSEVDSFFDRLRTETGCRI